LNHPFRRLRHVDQPGVKRELVNYAPLLGLLASILNITERAVEGDSLDRAHRHIERQPLRRGLLLRRRRPRVLGVALRDASPQPRAHARVLAAPRGQHIFGITPSQTISFLPIIMLAIIFGLSSDYEVFVVSRIKEEYTAKGDARRATQRGTGLSARVVTAAAMIMFSIFVAFMFTHDPTIKAIGFSFAAGVFLDAFVVRLTLVPAVMALAGTRMWYHPAWFAKHIPNPDIEGQRLEHKFGGEELAAAGTSARPG
jgi:hypothetical protein